MKIIEFTIVGGMPFHSYPLQIVNTEVKCGIEWQMIVFQHFDGSHTRMQCRKVPKRRIVPAIPTKKTPSS